MDKILSIQTIKNVFAALGAKTSDDNYGVALLDKTTAEPKGLMGMSDLASVLGVSFIAYKNGEPNIPALNTLGTGFFSANAAKAISGLPSDLQDQAIAIIRMKYRDGLIASLVFDLNGGTIYVRSSDTSAWVHSGQ